MRCGAALQLRLVPVLGPSTDVRCVASHTASLLSCVLFASQVEPLATYDLIVEPNVVAAKACSVTIPNELHVKEPFDVVFFPRCDVDDLCRRLVSGPLWTRHRSSDCRLLSCFTQRCVSWSSLRGLFGWCARSETRSETRPGNRLVIGRTSKLQWVHYVKRTTQMLVLVVWSMLWTAAASPSRVRTLTRTQNLTKGRTSTLPSSLPLIHRSHFTLSPPEDHPWLRGVIDDMRLFQTRSLPPAHVVEQVTRCDCPLR